MIFMKKKMLLSILLVLSLFIVTGCGNKEENNNTIDDNGGKESKVVEANTSFGWIKLNIPSDYEYHPELRGLIYSESDRKLFIKGDANDRSTAIIIDLMQQQYNNYLENYIEILNENLGDNGYKLKSEKPKYFFRDKYEGKSGDTVIYNYTFITKYENYIYTITVSGPQSKENELNDMISNIKKSIKVG